MQSVGRGGAGPATALVGGAALASESVDGIASMSAQEIRKKRQKKERAPKTKPEDFGRVFQGTKEGQKLEVAGYKAVAVSELKSKNPHVNWDEKIRKHNYSGTPLHGWISPKGEYHHLSNSESHDDFIMNEYGLHSESPRHKQDAAYTKAMKAGWIKLGVSGEDNFAGHAKVLGDRMHPATQKLREMARANPDWAPDEGVLEHDDKVEYGKFDVNHFIKHGHVKLAEGNFSKAEPLSKPYVSDAQRRWAHTEAGTEALGGKEAVSHWDEASRGKKLPKRINKTGIDEILSNLRLKKSDEPKQVSSIAVLDPTGRILMGARNDNNKWTLPGGHCENHENHAMGMVRELFEEAGITAPHLEYMGSAMGDPGYLIHSYKVQMPTQVTPSAKNDPDKEVTRWQWIDASDGLPAHVAYNLHSPNNVVLRNMGLIKFDPILDQLHLLKSRIDQSLTKTIIVKNPVPNSFHGVIDAEGTFHAMKPEEDHEEKIKTLTAQHNAQGKNYGIRDYMKVGIAGEPEMYVSAKHVHPHSPMMMTFRNQLKESLPYIKNFHLNVWDSAKHPSPVNGYDAHHYAKFGTLKPYQPDVGSYSDFRTLKSEAGEQMAKSEFPSGWIHPEGTFHPLKPGQDHEEGFKEHAKGTYHDEAYSRGWISVGHNGEHNAVAGLGRFKNPDHPATKTLKELASKHSNKIHLIEHGGIHEDYGPMNTVYPDVDTKAFATEHKIKPDYSDYPEYKPMSKSELMENIGDSLKYLRDKMVVIPPESK